MVMSLWPRFLAHLYNKSVPKIRINNTKKINFLIAVSILLISNHNSLRVLFDKIASVAYILFEKYIYISVLKMACPENQHCASCIGTLSFATVVPLPIASGVLW